MTYKQATNKVAGYHAHVRDAVQLLPRMRMLRDLTDEESQRAVLTKAVARLEQIKDVVHLAEQARDWSEVHEIYLDIPGASYEARPFASVMEMVQDRTEPTQW